MVLNKLKKSDIFPFGMTIANGLHSRIICVAHPVTNSFVYKVMDGTEKAIETDSIDEAIKEFNKLN